MKYSLYINQKHVGNFNTLKQCREYAKYNGGYRCGWSVWDNTKHKYVINNLESAVHLTNRIHNGPYEKMTVDEIGRILHLIGFWMTIFSFILITILLMYEYG